MANELGDVRRVRMRRSAPFKRRPPADIKTIWPATLYEGRTDGRDHGRLLPPNAMIEMSVNGAVAETVYLKMGSKATLRRRIARMLERWDHSGGVPWDKVEFRVYAIDRIDLLRHEIDAR